MYRMCKIISIVPKPFKWLVGYDEEEITREPFGTELRTRTLHCIPNDAKPPYSEGGNGVIVTLSCEHSLEWERPVTVYDSLEKWAGSLQDRVGRRVRCHQCSEEEE